MSGARNQNPCLAAILKRNNVFARFILLTVLVLPLRIHASVFFLDGRAVDALGETPGGDTLVLNHFDTGGSMVLIDRSSLPRSPLSYSLSPTVASYSDLSSDGDPHDAPPPLTSPIILSQPVDQTKPPGGLMTLAVVAEGTSPLIYQWFFMNNLVPGLTNAAFTMTNVLSGDEGPYFVTVSNAYGAITSAVANLAVSMLPPPACLQAPTGAVAWWRAESNYVDSISNNDALPKGLGAFYNPYLQGKVGAAFRFFPSGPVNRPQTNFLLVPRSADLNLAEGAGLSFEGWIKPDGLTGVHPVVEWNDGRGNIGAGLFMNVSALEAYFTDTNSIPVRRPVIRSPSGILSTSVWQHIALTLDKESGLARVFLNGTIVVQTNLGAFVPQTWAPVYLGYRPSGIYAGSLYFGGLDEMTLYDRALSAEEIAAIVAADSAGKCPPPPPLCVPVLPEIVAWWRGESNLLDSVDANSGTATGSVRYTIGVAGKALEFSDAYVRVAASSNLNVGAGSGMTIEGWIWPEDFVSYGDLSRSREFIGWQSTSTQRVSLSFVDRYTIPLPARAPLVWEANIATAEGKFYAIQSPVDLATIGAWQHVAITYDKGSGLAVLYFNGNAVTQTNIGTYTLQTTGDLLLGFRPSPPLPPLGLSSGALDEPTLYARALSAEEIRAIMLARSAGKCRQPPIIVTQPAGIRVNEGDDAAFIVTAAGNPVLKYQWQRNGTNLIGASGTSLVLTNVHLAQAALYSVRVTNAFGFVLSSNAVLTVNRSPVADATATRPLVIAPLHCSPVIVLDGSRSSDPDNDPLHLFWFKVGETSPFATGVVAVVTLALGTNLLTLVVDDGLATNSQNLVVEVITSAQAVGRLMTVVNSEVVRPQPLIASLSAAVDSLDGDNATAGANQLEAFENKTRAQVAPWAPDLADRLMRQAQTIIDVLSNGCSADKPHGKVGKVLRLPDGKVRLQFSAPPARIYLVETSSDLVNWERIGVATELDPGEFEFEHANASQKSVCFYRVVVP